MIVAQEAHDLWTSVYLPKLIGQTTDDILEHIKRRPFEINPRLFDFPAKVITGTFRSESVSPGDDSLTSEQAHDLAWSRLTEGEKREVDDRRSIIDRVREIDQTFGILSLTESSDNLLMWAHYADEHRGDPWRSKRVIRRSSSRTRTDRTRGRSALPFAAPVIGRRLGCPRCVLHQKPSVGIRAGVPDRTPTRARRQDRVEIAHRSSYLRVPLSAPLSSLDHLRPAIPSEQTRAGRGCPGTPESNLNGARRFAAGAVDRAEYRLLREEITRDRVGKVGEDVALPKL